MLKYENVARKILQDIEDNSYPQGTKLASIDVLVEDYQVSKNTVLKALNKLENAGIVYQVQGSGIFVRGHNRKGYINLVESQGFQSSLRDFSLSSKVIDLKIIKPTKEVKINLRIKADEDIYYIKRIRYINNRILCVEESYYRKCVVPYLNEQIVEDSIFDYLTNDLKIELGFVDHFLRVIPFNEDIIYLLDIDSNQNGILTESIYYLKNGDPFDYSQIIYHPDEAQFFVQGKSHYDLL